MDRNTIIGILLILAIFIGFSIYNTGQRNKVFEKTVTLADSLYKEGELEKARTEYMTALRARPNEMDIITKLNDINQRLGVVSADTSEETTKKVTPAEDVEKVQPVAQKVDSMRFGIFGSAAVGQNEFITLENNKLRLKISLKGGKVYSALVKNYRTYDSLPLILFDGDSTVFGLNFFTADNKPVQTNELYFKPVTTSKDIFVSSKPESVKLRLYASPEKYIEYTYTMSPDKYIVKFDVSFVSLEGIIANNQSNITLDWRMYIPQKERGRQIEENYTTIKYKYYQDEVDGFRERSNKEFEQADISTKLRWIAFKDQFFSSVLINDESFQNASISSTRMLTSPKYLRYFTAEIGVPFDVARPQPLSMEFYYGPNHFTTLKKEGFELQQLVTLGKNLTKWINQFIIVPIFNWLNRYISNYGLIILILTLLIKIVLFPLTFKSYQSQAKMAVLKPMVEELGKKFPKKEDSMKKQQATMDLYKRAGVNPMGGCLPMLLQMPILYAMFRFFPTSIELRQQSFLWATDLSTYDSILTLPFSIPIYGNHVSLFTLLMTASTILTMKMTGSSPGQDQPGMKAMTYMMPVMFMLILNNLSAGLTYYYFLANILTFVQNIISKRFINADEVLARLEANRKKPPTKSKWQQRLEQAARQRGINPPRK